MLLGRGAITRNIILQTSALLALIVWRRFGQGGSGDGCVWVLEFGCWFGGFFWESKRKHILISMFQKGLQKSLAPAVAMLQPCEPKFCIEWYCFQKCKFSRASTCNRRTGIKRNRKWKHWLSVFFSLCYFK